MPKKEDILREHFSELGKKGGAARAEKLSPAKRRAIAKKGAAARLAKLTPERRAEIARKAGSSPKPRRSK
jgi:hypothetical protein